jgi:pre-mRNA-processing factor 19
VISASEPLYPGSTSIATDDSGEKVIVGGLDGVAGVYSLSENKILEVMKVGGAITDAVWAGDRAIISASSGAVKVFEEGNSIASFNSHAGAANAIALHPSGEILASVGVDKSFVFYDLINSRPVTQVYTDCGLLPPSLNHIFTDF